MAELRSPLPFCSASTSVNPLPKEHQNLEKTSFSTLLYSNVRGLRQASGELCRVCMDLYPSIVCLPETHLCDDATDSFCPSGYVVAARRHRSKYGGGTSSAGTATLDFCESRGLHQLVTFPTRLNAILDLVMTEYL